MNIQSTLDIFHVTSAQIERQTSTNFAWYRIYLYGENSEDVFTITVFPSDSFDRNKVPPVEEFFKFAPTKDTMASLEASPAPASTSTSESNLEQ